MGELGLYVFPRWVLTNVNCLLYIIPLLDTIMTRSVYVDNGYPPLLPFHHFGLLFSYHSRVLFFNYSCIICRVYLFLGSYYLYSFSGLLVLGFLSLLGIYTRFVFVVYFIF